MKHDPSNNQAAQFNSVTPRSERIINSYVSLSAGVTVVSVDVQLLQVVKQLGYNS